MGVGGQDHPYLGTTGLNLKEASYGNGPDSLASATQFFPRNRNLMVGTSLPVLDFESHF